MNAENASSLPEDPLREIFGEPIHVYSRRQALADGVLIDVTAWAKGLFKIPVAVTSALWALVESLPRRLVANESPETRTRAILRATITAANRTQKKCDRVGLVVLLETATGLRSLELLAICGPGDTPEPVLTVGFPSDF